MIDKLINKAELSRLLKTNKNITISRVSDKHKPVIQELNELLEYWKKRNNL